MIDVRVDQKRSTRSAVDQKRDKNGVEITKIYKNTCFSMHIVVVKRKFRRNLNVVLLYSFSFFFVFFMFEEDFLFPFVLRINNHTTLNRQ